MISFHNIMRLASCFGCIPLMCLGSVVHAGGQPTTTIIAHGFTTGDKGVWVQAMGEAILARAGGGSMYRYQGASGAWTHVPVAEADGTHEHIVLIYNWVPESASPSPGPNWNYVQGAGDVLYAVLRSPKYVNAPGTPPSDLATGRALHFIGHSRGACMNSEAVKRFALAGITVDQYTGLDPHPVNGTLDARYNYEWGDPTPVRWNNITWADNYWRADGGGLINGLDFDGIPLANVFNTQLSESALNCCANSFAHLDVHLWYHGTIDTSPTASDGDYTITTTMRNTWYPPGPPIGYTERGFYYSVIGGGSAPEVRPVIPPGTAPDPVDSIFNGGFENGTYAGWGYHGGSVNGTVANESGNYYVRLGAGVGNSGGSATHNRFFLPANASAIVLNSRVYTASATESLRVSLVDDATGTIYVIGSIALNAVTGWIVDQEFPLGCTVPRSRNYLLRIEIISPGAIGSVAGVDNVRSTTNTVAADVTGDGTVGVPDLLAVINAWGPCGSPCPADVAPTGGDASVGVPDLLFIINNWGACP